MKQHPVQLSFLPIKALFWPRGIGAEGKAVVIRS
jgi:hypothetical protein